MSTAESIPTVEYAAYHVRSAVSDLVKLRVNPEHAGEFLAVEAELLCALASLQFLCSDLREERVRQRREVLEAAE